MTYNNCPKGTIIFQSGYRDSYYAYPISIIADGDDITNTSEALLYRPSDSTSYVFIITEKDYSTITINYNRSDRNLIGSILVLKPQ